MLTKQEEEFVNYWKLNAENEKKQSKYVLIGFTVGLFISIIIYLFVFSGWYIRATMDANTKMPPIIFSVSCIVISTFLGFFYRSYKWEQLNQQYIELLAKSKKNT